MSDFLDKTIRKIRSWLYKRGIRPNPDSIFYSPTLALDYAFRINTITEDFKKGTEAAMKAIGNLVCICGHKLSEHGLEGYDCEHPGCTCPRFRTQRARS